MMPLMGEALLNDYLDGLLYPSSFARQAGGRGGVSGGVAVMQSLAPEFR